MTSETTDRSHSAHATLHGYLYQVCLGVERSLDLRDGEMLVCEGDEDLDLWLRDGGKQFEQVKDYSRRLGLGDQVVVDTLRRFVRSYATLQQAGTPGRYVFTTTAEQSRRQKDGLDFDLLRSWRDGDRSPRVCDGVRSVVIEKEPPDWIQQPVAWLDGQPDGWKGFLDAVEWTFGAPDLDGVQKTILKRLADHPVAALLQPETFMDRLVSEVLQRSSRAPEAARTLTRDDLSHLAEKARTDLAKWGRSAAGQRVRQVFSDLEILGDLLTDNTRELEQPSPGALLIAAHEVIPFREAGRESEFAELTAWCNAEGQMGVMLMTGEGGAGKTRLAIEWCRRLRHQGWHAGFLQWFEPADLGPLLTGEAPRLVVIDYAETRLSVLKPLLYKMAVDSRPAPRVRLLLLSRRAGDWWAELRGGRERAETEHLLHRANVRKVTPLVPKDDRRSAFRAAAEAFGLARDGRIPQQLPEPPLTDARFDQALYLHMAALSALDGRAIESAEEALAATLTHERRFWFEQVDGLKLDGSLAAWMKDEALDPAVAGLTLVQGAQKDAARLLLGRVLTPPGGRGDLLASILKLLARLYGKEHDLEPLRPDLLGEELVARALRADIRLLDRVLDGAATGEAQNTLTLLTRLAQRRPEEGRAWLTAAFHGRLEQLAELAFEVAIETGDPVGLVLAQEIEKQASAELARRLMDRCEENRYLPSLPLREAGLAATRKCLALLLESPLDNEAIQAERARLANNLGNRLSKLGQREEALAATQEAVKHYRALSTMHPDAFLPNLAKSLNNLGNRLSDLGRREEALEATQEAVDHYRALSTTRPDAFLPDLALSLNNLGNRLCDSGRREEALEATQEAVDHYRALSTTHPDAFLPNLAMSLNNLGNRLSDLGRRKEALAATQEAVDHYRALSTTRPDAFLPELAGSLNNLGHMLSALGRREEAMAATQEAVDHYRALSTTRPDAFLPELALSLNNLGNRLGDLGRREEALAATQEAVDHYRALSTTHPDAFLLNLATSLNNLGIRLSASGRPEVALAAAEEAVRLLAPFFARYPDAFRQRLSITRNYLTHAAAVGREPDQALLASLVEPLGLAIDPPDGAPPGSPEG